MLAKKMTTDNILSLKRVIDKTKRQRITRPALPKENHRQNTTSPLDRNLTIYIGIEVQRLEDLK